MTWMLVSNTVCILNYVVCIDKESTSAGLYDGMLPVVDTCTIPYAHLLYLVGWDWETGAHRLWTTVDVKVD